MDLRLSSYASKFSGVRKERDHCIADQALNFPGGKSPPWGSSIGSIFSRRILSRNARDVVAITSSGLDGVAWRERSAPFVEEFSSKWTLDFPRFRRHSEGADRLRPGCTPLTYSLTGLPSARADRMGRS